MDRRLRRWVGVAGLAFVVLVVLSGVLSGNAPNTHASAAKVVAFYHKHKSGIAAQAYFVEAAIFVGLFFLLVSPRPSRYRSCQPTLGHYRLRGCGDLRGIRRHVGRIELGGRQLCWSRGP